MKNITIGDGVEEIGYGAFAYCKSLQSITIPGNVRRIAMFKKRGWHYDYTFVGCESLKEINYLNNVSSCQLRFGFNLTDDTFLERGYSSDEIRKLDEEISQLTERVEKMYIGRKLNYPIPSPNLKELTIGETVSVLDVYSTGNIQLITSYADKAPVSSGFTNNEYMNAQVRVPYEALESYRSDPVWGNFWNLQGFDPLGVDDLEAETEGLGKTVVGRFDLNGNPVDDEYKGIVIIRYSNGSTRKVVL